jgi:NAD-dependent DNA ligase
MVKKIFDIESLERNPLEYIKEFKPAKLVKLLKYLSDAYYNTGDAIVSDEIFDLLKDKLKEIDPKNKYLKEVGAEVKIKLEQKKLPFPMSSLEKIKPDTDALSKWMKKYKGNYIISDKLDGISAQLYINKNGLPELYTRGDGLFGQDISHLLNYVIGKIKLDKLPKELSIRGELIISKKNFEKIKTKHSMKNARNAVAGLVNSKDINIDIANVTEFISYNIMYPNYKQETQLQKLKEFKFKVVDYKVLNNLDNKSLTEYLIDRRKNANYEIDGIVVYDNSDSYEPTSENPDYAFAFKTLLDDQIAEATVVDVLWDVTKDMLLKPRIQITPVDLVGITITYATAFNAKFVKDNKLGPGAVIKIIRSGDVIPYIQEVLKPSKEAKMPDVKYKWNNTEVDIILDDKKSDLSDKVNIKKMIYFFKTMGIKNIDEGVLTKLSEAGYNELFKLLKADKKKLGNIEGLGEKSITKIFTNIENNLKNTNIETLMAASLVFGRGLGVKKIKLIIDKYPNIMNQEEITKDDILKVEGFSDILATKFTDNFNKFKTFFNKLKELYDIEYLIEEKEEKEEEQIFEGKTFVFTGFRDKDLEKFITDRGGKLSGSVSKKTFIVIYSETSGSKYKTAKDLNIKLMTKEEFENQYK